MAVTQAGLEGIVAAESEICFIDGDRGILSYRGFNIHTLAENATFEEVIYLLWHGSLPKQSELDALKADLVRVSSHSARGSELSLAPSSKMPPMDVLRTAVSMLGLYDPLARDNSIEASVEKAARLMAQTATIVTTFDRLRKGQPRGGSRSQTGIRGEFSLHSDRQEAGRSDGARIRHRADPACRSRAECVHLRRARDGRNFVRHPLRGDFGHRSAERSAARRRE